MRRSEKFPVPLFTLYLAVNVFEPAVKVTTEAELARILNSGKVSVTSGCLVAKAVESSALRVVAPLTAKSR